MSSPDRAPFSFTPIGVVRSPFLDKASAPRQPAAARDVVGRVELYTDSGFDDALSDLDGWDHLWLVFVFHLVTGWRPKVQPPRSEGGRKGVFATRSPHRPNPIGLSAVRLLRVEGLTVHIGGIDLVDGTPVLDLKPYVAYTDAIPEAKDGWLAGEDPRAAWEVRFSELARRTLAFLREHGVDLEARIAHALSLGPEPHAYRRIKADARGQVLAMKEWRVRFVALGRTIEVTSIETGYRPRQLHDDPTLQLHRALVERFG